VTGDRGAGDVVLEHGGCGEFDRGLDLDGDHVVAGDAIDGAIEGVIVASLRGLTIGVGADRAENIAAREDGNDSPRPSMRRWWTSWARMVARASRRLADGT
jgi:hypothetical protein